MNKLIFLISIIISSQIFAQTTKPNQVISFAEVEWTATDYAKLHKEWKTYLATNTQDANAWRNVYLSKYYELKLSKRYDEKGIKTCDSILDQMSKSAGNSWEYNWLMYKNGSHNPDFGKYLEKAYQINQTDFEIVSALIPYYALVGDYTKKKEVYKKWFKTNPLESFKMNLGYNIAISAEPNALIIAAGDNEVYPTEMVLYGLGLDPTIDVVYQGILSKDSYYKNLLKYLKMPDDKRDYSFYTEKNKNPDEAYLNCVNERLSHIIKNRNSRSVYFTLGNHEAFTNPFKSNLYLTGMLYKYSETTFDNISLLRKRFENDFLLDDLKVELNFVPEKSVKYRLTYMYVVPLMELYSHYKASGDIANLTKTKTLILKLADDYNVRKEIEAQLETI